MTALELVREVQQRLRLPQSPDDLSDAHGKLLMQFANTVMRNFMTDVWDELKVYGSFNT